jgi:hypothetical protein
MLQIFDSIQPSFVLRVAEKKHFAPTRAKNLSTAEICPILVQIVPSRLIKVRHYADQSVPDIDYLFQLNDLLTGTVCAVCRRVVLHLG